MPDTIPKTHGHTLPIAMAIGINTLAYSIVYPFLPIYLHKIRGIPMATAGLIFPIMGVAVVVGSPIAGALLDRIGRRKVLVTAPAVRGLFFMVLAVMAHINAPFAAFAALLFLTTLAHTFFINAANAYITDVVPPSERTEAFSTTRIGLNVGWMLGPAIGAFLARTPFSLLFGLTAVLCLLASLMVCQCCPQARIAQPGPHPAHTETLLQIVARDRQLQLLMALGLLLFLSVSQFVSTLAVFATDVTGISQNALGFLFTLNGAMVILLQWPVNRWLKQWNLHLRTAAGALMYVVAFIGIGASSHWWQLALCIALLTVGEIFAVTAMTAAASNLAPPDKVGRYMGAFGLVQGLGWAMGPFLGALVFTPLKTHPLVLWCVLASGAVLATVGFAGMAIPRRHATQNDTHGPA